MSKIKQVTVYEVDGKTFASKEEAESHLALKEFEQILNDLKDRIIKCELISPEFRVSYYAFSASKLDEALEVAKDIELLVNRIRKGRGC